MQGLCRLSVRWHQQFCHSARPSIHVQCIQALAPARTYRHTAKRRPTLSRAEGPDLHGNGFFDTLSEPSSSDIVVREYEQDETDPHALRKVEPTSELTAELREVRAQMEKLERELAVMKQGPFGPETDFMQSLPKDEREQLLKALNDEGVLPNLEDGMLSFDELDRLSEEDQRQEKLLAQRQVGVSLRISKRDHAHVRHFNRALRAVRDSEGDVQKSLILWTWYLRCQQHISKFSDIISQDVWEVLWRSQSQLTVRPKHIVMLAQDMLSAEEPLSDQKWHEYILALHASGDTATAVDFWLKRKEYMPSHSRTQADFQSLGVKLFAGLGRPLKAQELALNAIHHSRADPQILIPVLVAWARSQGPEALSKAWACYLTLRKLLGSSINPETFENISNAFLDADCADLALNVFKDMLLTKEQSQYDSRTVYRQATKHLEDVLQGAATEDQINHVGLSALLILPRTFQNRYFFTSWMKKLIGEGRVDSAAMVVELMYERGITPDAKPLNGIIGAWLREGSASSKRKAETMAKAMIEARIELVDDQRRARTANEELRQILPPQDYGHARRAVFLRKHFPPATIETFSIMLLHHTRRSNFKEAELLTETMTGPCQIKPNAFILNHWLYADLRSSRLQEVWAKFNNLTPDIRPDLETFAALWDAGKAQYSKFNPLFEKEFPSARQLFAEMTTWNLHLPLNQARRAGEEFSPELYEQIIRCFCLSGDLPGTLVALHGLHKAFGVFPTENSVRLICGSAARLLPAERKGRVKRTKARHRNVLGQVADIVETIESKQKLGLLGEGANALALQEPNSCVGNNLKLSVMTEFICTFLQQTQSSTGSYRNDIKLAAEVMGVDMNDVNLDVPNEMSSDDHPQ